MDDSKLRENFSKDLSNLAVIVGYAAGIVHNGSFSQRHPELGKMIRCPGCGHRRRANAGRCCNPKLTRQCSYNAKQKIQMLRNAKKSKVTGNPAVENSDSTK